MIQHPVTHLTSNYRKDKNSNNFKLLDLDHQEQLQIYKTLRLIEAWRDVDNAEGFTLDKIGKNVLELRNGRDNVSFRKAIKLKIRGNLSAGTIDDFNLICDILFGEMFISINETWHQESYNFEPAAVSIIVSHSTNEEAIFFMEAKTFLEDVTAGGVRIYYFVTSERPATSSDLHIGGAGIRTSRRDVNTHDPAMPVTSELYIAVGNIRFSRRME